LYTLGTDGAPPARRTTNDGDTAPAAAPSGESIAFMSNRTGNWDIYLLDGQQSGEPKRLTDSAAAEGLPAWSPDGQWLAFVSDRSGSWAVWIMRPDGSQQHRLFTVGGPLEGQQPSISPHGQLGWTWETLAWGP
jgi:TolB protein